MEHAPVRAYQRPKRAKDHLEKWMPSAMRSRLEPFKKFFTLYAHMTRKPTFTASAGEPWAGG